MGWNRYVESARRIYGELVRGRTRVRVVEPQTSAASTTPKFIMSPYRSGTTLLRYCLDSHPSIAVPPETDFLVHFGDVLLDEASVKGMSDLGYGESSGHKAVSDFGRTFLDTYAASRNKPEWVDKSPRYAESPRAIEKLYPDAVYLIMHRHPLDQIHSFTKGGSYTPFALKHLEAEPGDDLVKAAACYWRDVTRNLIEFADETATRSLTISYEDLCDEPRATLEAALSHFGFSWNDSVLNYHLFDHDLGREAGRVQGTVGFTRSEQAWREWSPELIDHVWAVVGDTASLLGYVR